KYSPGWRTMPLSIDMSPEKARTLKNNISVLLLCKPTLHESSRAPFSKGNNLIFEGTSYSKATMDSPTSLSYDGKFINVEAVSVWVYETNTGSILLKNDLPDRKAQANPDSGEQNAIDSGRQGIAEKFVGEFVSMNEAAKTLIAKGQTEMTFDVSGLRRMPTLTAGDMVTVVFVEKDGKNIAKAVVRRR
ncbi:MAG: hypothetical protein LLG04_15950, partial [Parachlamydia sp.]|nr:hypothetical protein [Parachlamydia sp.]